MWTRLTVAVQCLVNQGRIKFKRVAVGVGGVGGGAFTECPKNSLSLSLSLSILSL